MSSMPLRPSRAAGPSRCSTRPGATTFTWMPCWRPPSASVNASASIAALPMLYGRAVRAHGSVATLEMKTMSPRSRSFIVGSSSRHRWCGPMACAASTRCTSSGSVVGDALARAGDAGVVARGCRRSRSRRATAPDHALVVVERVDRAAYASARRPSFAIAVHRLARRRPRRGGSSPRRRPRPRPGRARWHAPMPRPPPVTNATRPSRSAIGGLSSASAAGLAQLGPAHGPIGAWRRPTGGAEDGDATTAGEHWREPCRSPP